MPFFSVATPAFAAGLTILLIAVVSFSRARPPEAMTYPGPGQPDDLAAELEASFVRDVSPLLGTYCLSCHEGDEPSGDLRLDQVRGAMDALTTGVDLRLIKEMVNSGAMPPKRSAQPTEHERLAITQWIDSVLNYVPANAPIDPGWFTIHRLNRTEYRFTMRDLLGIDPAQADLAVRLPRDDTGYGFDNIADVLSTSPLSIEEYVAAAERAIDIALGPVLQFSSEAQPLRPIEGSNGQPLSRGGFMLYSNGPATVRFTAPATADYLIRFSAWETPGGDEHARLSLRVGTRRIEQFSVSGVQGEPESFEHRTRIKRGEHAISLHFLNDFYLKDVADRNVGIESISVAGPLDEETTERPAQWTTIFRAGVGSSDDDAAAALSSFAARAYRRPPSDDQVASLMRVYRSQRAEDRSFEEAVRVALTAVLVSPNFLFRSVAHPDAGNSESRYRLDGYELASRLSYFLWSSMPDEPLMAAAGDGSLLTDDGLVHHTRRMLADPRSAAFVENFSGQWLQLRGLEDVSIDRARYPMYDDTLRSAMIAEATLFVGDVLRSGRSVLEFIDSRDTFLNERLAGFYNIDGVSGDEFRRVMLPADSPRGGVLTMGAVLTLTSNTTRTSPVKRGLFVLDQILGAPPPPPPPDIPPLEQAARTRPDASVREQLAAHVANPSCAACHIRLDPIGLSFEHFDAIGQWRDTENSVPIDATGTLPDGVRLNGSNDLKRTLLTRSDQFVEALSAKVLTYALGRGVEPFDRPAIRLIARRTRAHNDTFPALIESIVLSDTFRTCRGRIPTYD